MNSRTNVPAEPATSAARAIIRPRPSPSREPRLRLLPPGPLRPDAVPTHTDRDEPLPAVGEDLSRPAPGTVGPPLEQHFHTTPGRRPGLDKYSLALQIDARLVVRRRVRTKLERAHAAVARALLESKAYLASGYTNPRDYARDELGISLRALQELARLDKVLTGFPLFDEAVSSGGMTACRALEVAPVLTKENERSWFALARKHTVRKLRELVNAFTMAQGASVVGYGHRGGYGVRSKDPAAPLPPEPEGKLKQRAPWRSRMLWDAFREESARSSGGPTSQAQALEALLAEFWPLVPDDIAARVRGTKPVGAAVSCPDEDDDEDGEWVSEPAPIRSDVGSGSAALSPDGRGAGSETGYHKHSFILQRDRASWRRELIDEYERMPGRKQELDALDRRAVDHVCWLLTKGAPVDLPVEDQALLDISNLKGMDVRGLEGRYRAIRKRLRRLAVDEGALLFVMRGFQLYRCFQYGSFGHYTRDRVGLARRTAEDRAITHRMLFWDQGIKDAWMRDLISEGHLGLFRRLMKSGIRGSLLKPWLGRAAEVTVATFGDQVRWLEACQQGYWGTPDPFRRERREPKLPPTPEEWVRIRSELNRNPDLFVWLAHGWRMSAQDGAEDGAAGPQATAAGAQHNHPEAAEAFACASGDPRPESAAGSAAGSDSVPAAGSASGSSPFQAPPPPAAMADVCASVDSRPSVSRAVPDEPLWASVTADVCGPTPRATRLADVCADPPTPPGNGLPKLTLVPPPGPAAATNPLVPSPAEPATCTMNLYGPPEVLQSYLEAVEAVRAIHGPDRPAWWCLEVMILHVRRDWAVQSAYSRRNVEHYEIYERDGFRCTAPGCTSRRHLHAHHLWFASHGGPDDPWNLTTLCMSCHLFALHRESMLIVYGKAPYHLTWELGHEIGLDGVRRPRRKFVNEFRVLPEADPELLALAAEPGRRVVANA